MKRKLTILAWSLYDFANTIFSMNVISLYFALWVTVDKQGADIIYSIAISGSMLLAAGSAPFLGAISDKLGKRMPFLIIFTIICCLFTAAIGFIDSLLAGLLCFVGANYCFQVADVFYNSLLPQISSVRNLGKVSGFGVSLGYFGTIVGLILVSPFVLRYGRQAAFLPTGIYFFLFALPCFLLVKDTIFVKAKPESVIKKALSKVKNTLVNIRQYSNLFYFLIAAFIALNAINTAYIFMSIYIKKVAQFSDAAMIVFYIISSGFAILGAFVIGFITDKYGAKKTFMGVLFLWCLGALLAVVAFNKPMFWVVGPIVGISLGGTWTSARALVVKLSPAEMVGEVFGFYGLVGKTATIIGPMVWGSCVWLFGFMGIIKYRLTVLVLILFLILGMLVLTKVKETDNSRW